MGPRASTRSAHPSLPADALTARAVPLSCKFYYERKQRRLEKEAEAKAAALRRAREEAAESGAPMPEEETPRVPPLELRIYDWRFFRT